jgi:hypothetical protein
MTLRQIDDRRSAPVEDEALLRAGRAIVFVVAPSVAAGALLLALALALAHLSSPGISAVPGEAATALGFGLVALVLAAVVVAVGALVDWLLRRR